jgi:hypothetical protein
MVDKVIKAFSDYTVQDHALGTVAQLVYLRSNPDVLARILLYTSELERYKKHRSHSIYKRSNYAKQDIVYR